jgi:hypothetical protein
MGFKIGKPKQGAGAWDKAAHEGALLAFAGITYEADIVTSFGTTDAARVQYIGVVSGASDSTLNGTITEDALLFGNALVPALTGAEGEVVIGRLVKGTAKAGQSAPWLLADPTEEEVAEAEAWLDKHATKTKGGAVIFEAPF